MRVPGIPDVGLPARGPLQLIQQGVPLGVRDCKVRLPGAQLPCHPQPGPVQRPVVVRAEITACRPLPLRPRHGPPPQRGPVPYDDAPGLCERAGGGQLTCELPCRVVESGAPEDRLRYGPVEPQFLDGGRRCRRDVYKRQGTDRPVNRANPRAPSRTRMHFKAVRVLPSPWDTLCGGHRKYPVAQVIYATVRVTFPASLGNPRRGNLETRTGTPCR